MFKQLLVTVIVAYGAYHFLPISELIGAPDPVYNHRPGPCHRVSGIDVGSEDMDEMPDGVILITSGIMFNGFNKSAPAYQGRKGSIKLFDFSRPEKAETVALEHDGGFDPQTFNPHGMSVWHDVKTGVVSVFVVNHQPKGKEFVERFQYDMKRRVLKHLESFPATEDVYYLNDIVAVGPRSFYYTNYQYFIEQPYAKLEMLLALHWGGVGYYDGETGTTKVLHKGMLRANGINRSPDGKFIYVANPQEKDVLVFNRNNDNSLTLLQTFKMHTGPDNLWVSPDGKSIWTATHPIRRQIQQQFKDGVTKSASQVLRLNLEDGLISSVQQVMMDDGQFLSSSSVAIYRDGKMIVGTITNTALVCEIKYL